MADATLTALLRASNEDLWRRLRELLRERGMDPDATQVEQSFEDDDRYEFGVVVTPDGQRFEYGIDYSETPLEAAQFTEWRQLAD